ncbi:hypothetical protein [Streptomyces sp. ODS28]|uniref:hypothetical protein n=1 Tax=Streptomyces sp. ODS28 TaxID=3136688 RepID=UPI0031EC0E58
MEHRRDRLYDLLPSVYRRRDAEEGEPLKALLSVIEQQVRVLEDDIDGLYANWFVETCADWVLPYLGDLVGQQPLSAPGSLAPARILSPRRDVADAIANRRRKGSLALLEELASDVAGWPSRIVEFAALLGRTPHLGLRATPTARGRLLDVRRAGGRGVIDGPFDHSAHTVDVRGVNSLRSRGRYNIPHLGLFVWRRSGFTLTQAPAFCIDRAGNLYTFSILGDDVPLHTRPIPEPHPTHIAEELNLPGPIDRRTFAERTPDYYGPGRSLVVLLGTDRRAVPLEQIVPADLSHWAYRPVEDQVAVDPELGRIAFSPRSASETGVWVSYAYGMPGPLGGGEYPRQQAGLGERAVFRVGPHGYRTVMAAVEAWKAAGPGQRDAVIEFTDNGVYEEPIEIRMYPGEHLEMRAAAGTRPVIRLLNWSSNRPDGLRVTGPGPPRGGYDPEDERAPSLTLEGLLVTGRGIQATGALGRIVLRHCTLVPGWTAGCEPQRHGAGRPSLDLRDTQATVEVHHCILGPVRVNLDETRTEPLAITVADSVLDARADDCPALDAPENRTAHACVSMRRATVFGAVRAHALDLAEDTLFTGPLEAARRATGCVRFCYVPPGSHTPARYHCPLASLRPRFTSVRYGHPGYAQLAAECPPEITRGASDASQMGVYHDLFEPQRTDGLRARIDQFTPAGMETGIFFVT